LNSGGSGVGADSKFGFSDSYSNIRYQFSDFYAGPFTINAFMIRFDCIGIHRMKLGVSCDSHYLYETLTDQVLKLQDFSTSVLESLKGYEK